MIYDFTMTILDNLIKEAWRRGIQYKARMEELIVHKLNLSEQKGDMKHGWKECVGKTRALDPCGHFPCGVRDEKVTVTKPWAEILDTVESHLFSSARKALNIEMACLALNFRTEVPVGRMMCGGL